eukprot:1963821-Rhodomonas_salina.1
MVLSLLELASRPPAALNAQHRTSPVCPGSVCKSCPCADQTFISLSLLTLAMMSNWAQNASARTAFVCPFMVVTTSPLSASRILIVRSWLADTTLLLSGKNSALFTARLWSLIRSRHASWYGDLLGHSRLNMNRLKPCCSGSVEREARADLHMTESRAGGALEQLKPAPHKGSPLNDALQTLLRSLHLRELLPVSRALHGQQLHRARVLCQQAGRVSHCHLRGDVVDRAQALLEGLQHIRIAGAELVAHELVDSPRVDDAALALDEMPPQRERLAHHVPLPSCADLHVRSPSHLPRALQERGTERLLHIASPLPREK